MIFRCLIDHLVKDRRRTAVLDPKRGQVVDDEIHVVVNSLPILWNLINCSDIQEIDHLFQKHFCVSILCCYLDVCFLQIKGNQASAQEETMWVLMYGVKDCDLRA